MAVVADKRRSRKRTAVGRRSPLSIDKGPLNHYLGFALQRARATVFAVITKQLQAFNLSPGEFGVLVVIQRNPGLRFTDVTRALGFRETNFAPLIRELEQRGLVVRRSSKSDKRTKTLELTPRGEQLIVAAVASQDAYEASLVARVGESMAKQLHRALMDIAGETSPPC
jgi:DNA-binding MarR family transcriptional regulator